MFFTVKKNFSLLLIVFIIAVLLNFVSNTVLQSNDLIISSLSERLTLEQINEFIGFKQKWEWVGYSIIPVVLLIKVTLVSLCLSLGKFFTSIEDKYAFKEYFRIALSAEFVFLFVGAIKLSYFLWFKTDYTLEDIQYFYPLSALNLFDYKEIDTWLIYPLQTTNVFEIAYWFVLAYGIMNLLQIKFGKAFELVLMSYGISLIIWVGCITFLTLNMS